VTIHRNNGDNKHNHETIGRSFDGKPAGQLVAFKAKLAAESRAKNEK